MKHKKLVFIPLILTFFLTGCLNPDIEENSNNNGDNNNTGENGNGTSNTGNGDNGNGTSTNENVAFPSSALQSFCESQGITTTIPVPETEAKWTSTTETQEVGNGTRLAFIATAPDADKTIFNAYHTKVSALTDWEIAEAPNTPDSYYGVKGDASIGYKFENNVFNFGVVKMEEHSSTPGQTDNSDPNDTGDNGGTDVPGGTTEPGNTDPTTPGSGDVDPSTPGTTDPDPTTPVNPDPDPGTDPVNPDPGTDPVNPDPGTDPGNTPGTDPTPVAGDGTAEHPYSVTEAWTIIDGLNSGANNGKVVYVTGTVTGTVTHKTYGSTFDITDGTKTINAYSIAGVSQTVGNDKYVAAGYTVVVSGALIKYVKNNQTTYEVGYVSSTLSSNLISATPGQGGSSGGNDTPSNTTFPVAALQSFLTSEGYTTTVPSPVSNGDWEYFTEDDQDFGYSFIAYVEDNGTIGTNSLEDTYKALLLQNSWEVDDTYYDSDGYYAWKGDVALLFYTYDGEFDLYVFSINNLGGSSQTLPEDNDPTFEGPATPNAEAEWTLMFYVCGSDLESGSGRFATGDIEEIVTTAGKPDNVNIVFETGGCYDWDDTYNIKATRLSRFHLENGNLVNDAQLELDSMGKPETLQSFLEWGMTYYPAEKYGVFMWNHGGGMDGCEFDEIYNNDCLTLTEFNEAVTSAKTTCGVDKLEFVAYDACLMAIQDIAGVNAANFNYMLSSQESESGFGYDYDAWLPSLYNNPTTIGTADLLEEIGHTFLVEEEKLFEDNNWGESDQTQSVYDLSKMAAYQAAFEELVSGLSSLVNSSSKWSTFVNNNIKANGIQQFGVDEDGNYLYDIYDAEDVLDKIAANYSSLATKVATAKAALKAVVVYEEHGSGTSGCGMNIFCPTVSQYNRYYKTDTTFINWWTLCGYSNLCLESY